VGDDFRRRARETTITDAHTADATMKASIGVVSLLFFAAMTASALTISQFTPRAVVSPRVYLQEAGFTAEQTAALEEASISLRRVGEQKTDFGRDRTFFFALRNKNEDPSELDLQFLKEYWPVLADKSDAEIIEALAPIKAIEVDYRTVAANAGPRNPGPTY
jgi:hypothetical protein